MNNQYTKNNEERATHIGYLKDPLEILNIIRRPKVKTFFISFIIENKGIELLIKDEFEDKYTLIDNHGYLRKIRKCFFYRVWKR
jgi:hypothetical protein